jgi:hypothetical protein
LGEAGVDAFTIMRIAGHSSVTVSQKYVHPSTAAMERAFERLETLNAAVEPERTSEPEKAAKGSPPAAVSATLREAVSERVM